MGGTGILRWGARFLELFLPPACAGCGAYLPSPRGTRPGGGARRGGPAPNETPRICPGCLSRLAPLPHPRCSRCDAPRGSGLPAGRPCPHCAEWPPALVAARSAFRLAPPADALVHALKYGGWPGLAGELAERMTRLPIPEGTAGAGGMIVPVPTTRARLRSRGYNQAELLAREVADRVDGTLVDALFRREGGESQVALRPGERRANVQGAFQLREACAGSLRGREILLVDDVLTTGATASAAAEALSAGGAVGVTLLTFARALPE